MTANQQRDVRDMVQRGMKPTCIAERLHIPLEEVNALIAAEGWKRKAQLTRPEAKH